MEQAAERDALHIRRGAQRGQVEKCGREIHIGNDVVADTAGADLARVADQKGHLEGFLVHEAFVEPTMLAEEEALVRRVDDYRVGCQPWLCIQLVEQPPDVVVDGRDGAQVALHVPLKFEFGQLCRRAKCIHLARLAVDQAHGRHVFGIGDLALIPTWHQKLAHLVPAFRLDQPQVAVRQVVGHAHFGHSGRAGSVLVVVGEGVRELDVVLVQVLVFRVALPRPVRRFVMAHEEERPCSIPATDPIDGLVRDDVRGVTFFHHPRPHFDHLRVEIVALTRQHRPVVKTGRLMIWPFSQMPLADHGGLIAAVTELFRHVGQAVVEDT